VKKILSFLLFLSLNLSFLSVHAAPGGIRVRGRYEKVEKKVLIYRYFGLFSQEDINDIARQYCLHSDESFFRDARNFEYANNKVLEVIKNFRPVIFLLENKSEAEKTVKMLGIRRIYSVLLDFPFKDISVIGLYNLGELFFEKLGRKLEKEISGSKFGLLYPCVKILKGDCYKIIVNPNEKLAVMFLVKQTKLEKLALESVRFGFDVEFVFEQSYADPILVFAGAEPVAPESDPEPDDE